MGSSQSTSSAEDLQIFINGVEYERGRCLGKGSFSKVRALIPKNRSKSHNTWAIKEIQKSFVLNHKYDKNLLSEREILSVLQGCPFVVTLVTSFQTEDLLCLVLEFLSGGELKFVLKKKLEETGDAFSEEFVRFYAANIILALECIHSKCIVHRDIKLQNILLDSEGFCCVTDFNVAKMLGENEQTSEVCGTLNYMAPEVLMNQKYDQMVDWWSLGIVLFELAKGYRPFQANHSNKNVRAMKFKKIVTTEDPDYSELSSNFTSLLQGLLEKDPTKRLNAKALKEHPYFDGFDWDKLKDRKLIPPTKPTVGGLNFDPSAELEEMFKEKEKHFPLTLEQQKIFKSWDWKNPKYIDSSEPDEPSWFDRLAINRKVTEFIDKRHELLSSGLLIYSNKELTHGMVLFSFTELPIDVTFFTDFGASLVRGARNCVTVGGVTFSL